MLNCCIHTCRRVAPLYTMKKIDGVQMTLLRGSKEWKELDNASMACVYTFLMLFLFSIAVGVILHKFVMVVLYQMCCTQFLIEEM